MQNFGLLKVSLLVAYNTQLLGFAGNDIFGKSFQQHSPRWWLFMVIYHCRIRKKKHIQPVRLFGLRS